MNKQYRYILLFRSLILFLSVIYSADSYSTDYWYPSIAQASAASSSRCTFASGASCTGTFTANPPSGTNTTICAVTGVYSSYNPKINGVQYKTDTYYGCSFGYNSCSSGVRTVYGTCPVAPTSTPLPAVTPTPTPVPQIQDCPINQYRNSSGNCVATPDCNKNSANGGYYYDVNSGGCVASPAGPICVGSFPKSCPATGDCLPSGAICSNNGADISAANASGSAVAVDAKKVESEADRIAALQAQHDADAAAFSKDAQAKSAADNAIAAQDAANLATWDSKVAAQQAAATASQQAADAATKAANSDAQAAEAARQLAIAETHNANVQNLRGTSQTGVDFGPGYATNEADAVRSAAGAARNAANGGLAGTSPSGTGTSTNSTCPDCAKEATLQQLMSGSTNGNNRPAQTSTFDTQLATDAVTAAKTEFQTAFDSVRTQINSLFNSTQSTAPELPVFDYGIIKGAHVVVDLNNWAVPLSYFADFVIFMSLVTAVRIFLE